MNAMAHIVVTVAVSAAVAVGVCLIVIGGTVKPTPVPPPLVIDVKTPLIERWETDTGEEILPPETTTVGAYVEGSDWQNERDMIEFKSAFETDLHNGDPTFHKTHELIDGREW